MVRTDPTHRPPDQEGSPQPLSTILPAGTNRPLPVRAPLLKARLELQAERSKFRRETAGTPHLLGEEVRLPTLSKA